MLIKLFQAPRPCGGEELQCGLPPKLGAPCAAGLVAQFSPSPRSSAEHPVSKSSGEVKNQFLPMSETVSCPISALTLHRFPARRKICKPSDVFGNLEKKKNLSADGRILLWIYKPGRYTPDCFPFAYLRVSPRRRGCRARWG